MGHDACIVLFFFVQNTSLSVNNILRFYCVLLISSYDGFYYLAIIYDVYITIVVSRK
jgi:hypothetical protein